MAKFEKVSRFRDVEVKTPIRATKKAAGYDMFAAEDIVIPPLAKMQDNMMQFLLSGLENSEEFMEQMNTLLSEEKIEEAKELTDIALTLELEDLESITKRTGCRPTLVSTGHKVKLEDGKVAKLFVRSSSPLKYLLILANSTGIIDGDYYNCSANEGEIFFQFLNLSPVSIIIRKGQALGQCVIEDYDKTENDIEGLERTGGFGSTTE